MAETAEDAAEQSERIAMPGKAEPGIAIFRERQ